MRVVILTTFDLDEYVYAALRAGASGFLLKDAPPETSCRPSGWWLRVTPSSRRGSRAASSRSSPAGLNRCLRRRPGLTVLTEREREVLALVGRDHTNAEIAGHLYVSPATAKTHVSHIMTKLDARDRAPLVVVAYESGLVRPGN